MGTRYTPHVEVTNWSECKSSREGAKPTLIVIHAAVMHPVPGVKDLVNLGNLFHPISFEASSHVATDGEGHSARFVRDEDKAWHVAGFNRMALGIEQIIMADGTGLTRDLYRETARWVARWSKKYHIPIRKGAVSGSSVIRTGVVRHSELGAVGGGHSDPGPYDMHAMLSLARFYRENI
jgi:N-acetyl-anhydromuramyl-L-alanine amidase AmpD